MEKKEYTPEEIAVLEAKAAKYDKSQKRKKKLIIGGGVLVGFFIAGVISSMVNENTDEDTDADETSENSDETVVESDVVIEGVESADVNVQTENVEL